MNGTVSLRLRLETAGYQEPSRLKQAEGPFLVNADTLSVHCRAKIVRDFLRRPGWRVRRERLA